MDVPPPPPLCLAEPSFSAPPPPILKSKLLSSSSKQQLALNLLSMHQKLKEESDREIVCKLCSTLLQQLQKELFSVDCFSLFNRIEPVLQDGPMCGLVAVAMAAKIVGAGDLSADVIYEAAKGMGYTKQGEMFSAMNMCRLATELLACEGEVIDFNRDQSMEMLLDGKLLLVPYDRYYNNEPCNRNGHGAHWALISGIVIFHRTSTPCVLSECSDIDQEISWLSHVNQQKLSHLMVSNFMKQHQQHQNSDSHTGVAEILCPGKNDNIPENSHVFVYANQGKSIRTHLWRLDGLVESNQQLFQLCPEFIECIDEFSIPPEGIAGGLCGKAVVLWKDRKNYR